MWSSYSCCDVYFPPVYLLDKLQKVYLFRSRHWLVLTHVLPLEVYEGSSSQHVLDGDAKTILTSPDAEVGDGSEEVHMK